MSHVQLLLISSYLNQARVEMEKVKREFLCNSSQALKMESTFDATSERECNVCLFDLHLSAAGCHYCSPDKYACLNHAKQLCACSWGAKFFLFRYDVNELNILVEALEGKLSAVYRWARSDLGLALSSCISKENSQASGNVGKSSSITEQAALRGITSALVMANSNHQKEKGCMEMVNSPKAVVRTCLKQREKPPVELVDSAKRVCSSLSNFSESAKNSSPIQSKKDSPPGSDTRGSPRNISVARNLIPKLEMKPSYQENNDVILLSDDEGEELGPKSSESTLKTPKNPSSEEDHLMNNTSCSSDMGSTKLMTSSPLMSAKTSSSELMKTEDLAKGEINLGGNQHDNISNRVSSSCSDAEAFSSLKDNKASNMPFIDDKLLNSQPCDADKPNSENIHRKLESDVNLMSMDSSQNVSCNPSGSQNNLDRYFRQKGPRIAKVVRRINCNVEPLDFGVVHPGKIWCDTHAIYPKGITPAIILVSSNF